MTDNWNESQRRHYRCQRVKKPLDLHGDEPDPHWEQLPWSESFVDITGVDILEPRYRTRVRMGWDDRFLYIFAELEEPHVWGSITEPGRPVFEDNDFEVFIDPDGDGRNYYELQVNALGTICELCLPKPYSEGGSPLDDCGVDGLKSVVRVNGTLNEAADWDEGWTVEFAIPWQGLARFNEDGTMPPVAGDSWRFNFARVEWRHDVVNGSYVRVPPQGPDKPESLDPERQQHPEDNWVWSPQGAINMHMPERWGDVEFV